MAIVKFESAADHLEQLGGRYSFEVLDRQNHELYIVQVAGTSKLIDDFLQDLGEERIIDVARSGFTVLEK